LERPRAGPERPPGVRGHLARLYEAVHLVDDLGLPEAGGGGDAAGRALRGEAAGHERPTEVRGQRQPALVVEGVVELPEEHRVRPLARPTRRRWRRLPAPAPRFAVPP